MKNSKIFVVALTAGLLASTSLYATDMQTAPTGQANENQSQVQMVSGGIGDGEIDAINQAQKNYSVKLVYTMKNGEYISDVKMQVLDAHKNTVVNTASAGPIVLLNLKPGNYTLVSNVSGDSKTQKIAVRDSGLSTYIVQLNDNES